MSTKDNHTDISFLKEERIRLGYMSKEVADYAGISLVAQSRYENRKRTPDGKYYLKVSELGFDLHFVITGKRGILTLNEKEKILIRQFRKINTKKQEWLIFHAFLDEKNISISVDQILKENSND